MILDLDERDIERIAEAVSQRLEAPSQSAWMDAAEAAEYLRCSTRHLNKLAYLGEIPTYKPAGKRLFRRADLEQFITDRRED